MTVCVETFDLFYYILKIQILSLNHILPRSKLNILVTYQTLTMLFNFITNIGLNPEQRMAS